MQDIKQQILENDSLFFGEHWIKTNIAEKLILLAVEQEKERILNNLPDYKLNSNYMEYGDKKTFAEGWNMCKNEVRDLIINNK